MTAPLVLVVGDVMVDVTARITSPIAYASDTPAAITLQPGGSAATTAAWLAHAGHRAAFVGAVGADPLGALALAGLKRAGVIPLVRTVAGRTTGTCIVIVDASGERTMLPDPGANGALRAADADAAELGPADHLHVSGYALLNAESRDEATRLLLGARAAGATISLDPASAGPLSQDPGAVLDVLRWVDVVVANEDEARVLAGTADAREALAHLAGLVPVAVVKRGGRGAIARSGAEEVDEPALPVEVVDTTGAGDAFAAGFLPAWKAGRPLAEAVSAGHRLAAVAVGRVGAGPALPTDENQD